MDRRRKRTRPKKSDLLAGLAGAVANIPDAMANAVLAGLNPVVGLYALFVGTPAAAMTTGSQYLTVAVTAAMALAVGDVLVGVPSDQIVGALAALTICVGIVQILLGRFKAGTLMRFVSNAVMRGFLTGVALSIAISQIPEFTGTTSDAGSKLTRAFDIIIHPLRMDFVTLAVGVATILLIIGLELTSLRKLAVLGAVLATTVVVVLFDADVKTVGDIAQIPSSLPIPALPRLGTMAMMAASSIPVAIIGLVQAAAVSKSLPNADGRYPDISQDFFGQGVGNVASSLIGGMPVGGSVSSTALMTQAGAKTRWANFAIGPIIGIVLVAFGPYVMYIPMASLAAVLVLVGLRAVDFPRVAVVWSASYVAGAVMLITLFATLIMPVHYAVAMGMALSFVQHIYSASLDVHVVEVKMSADGRWFEGQPPKTLSSSTLTVIDIYGSIFYAGVDVISEMLPDIADAKGAVVILRLRGRTDVGSTFLELVQRYALELTESGGKFMLAGVGPELLEQLERTGLIYVFGERNVFQAHSTVGASLEVAVEQAEKYLAEQRDSGLDDSGKG